MDARTVVIQANTGFYLAAYVSENKRGPHIFVLSPIIAWEIELTAPGARTVTPLTMEGHPKSYAYKTWMIKEPSGSNYSPFEARFETEEAALNYFKLMESLGSAAA